MRRKSVRRFAATTLLGLLGAAVPTEAAPTMELAPFPCQQVGGGPTTLVPSLTYDGATWQPNFTDGSPGGYHNPSATISIDVITNGVDTSYSQSGVDLSVFVSTDNKTLTAIASSPNLSWPFWNIELIGSNTTTPTPTGPAILDTTLTQFYNPNTSNPTSLITNIDLSDTSRITAQGTSTSVPEPVSTGLLGVAGIWLLLKWRGRSSVAASMSQPKPELANV